MVVKDVLIYTLMPSMEITMVIQTVKHAKNYGNLGVIFLQPCSYQRTIKQLFSQIHNEYMNKLVNLAFSLWLRGIIVPLKFVIESKKNMTAALFL